MGGHDGAPAFGLMPIFVRLIGVAALLGAVGGLWRQRSRLGLDAQAWPEPHRPAGRQLHEAFRVEIRLVRRLRAYRKTVALGLSITVIMTVVGVAQPWPSKILVDNVLVGRGQLFGLSRQGALAVSVLSTVVLLLLSGSLGLLQTKVLFGLAQRLIRDLRAELFGHLTRASLHYHDEWGAGDSIYRVTTDSYAVQSVLLDGLVPLVAALLTLVGTLAIMVRLDPLLALLALVSVPAAAVLTRRFGGRIRSLSLRVHERESEVFAHAEQTLSGIRTVQAFARESYELERFSERANESRAAMMRLVTQQTMFGLSVDLVLALGVAVVTWVAAQRALDGQLTPGEVLVLLAYAGSLYGPVSGLATVYGELKAAAAGAQRVFEVLDQDHFKDGPGARAPRSRAIGRVSFEDVVFGYQPDHDVVHGIDLDAAPGRTVAIVGPTGAGKSTIVSLLVRLYDPRSGRITLDGVDLRTLPIAWVREQVALVPQDSLLFPVSVRENIRYGRLDATDAEVEDAARMANILVELQADPRGLDAPVGDRGVTLSVGQRQRVAIARAFLKDAPVIVLDEPTSALDAGTEVLVMDAVDRLIADRTCIVIAHRLSTVHRADEILVVDGGRVVQRGRHEELMRDRGLYRRLHDARFGRESGPAPLVNGLLEPAG
ncbi:MAG: ABC transporter ATP-binding protein/permease [Actinobacteria bacterium]|nr:ABC transporter ATP-binding protein/permease [Actinomycetota bacterium]